MNKREMPKIFTLIELLVLIAIICLLTSCQNNSNKTWNASALKTPGSVVSVNLYNSGIWQEKQKCLSLKLNIAQLKNVLLEDNDLRNVDLILKSKNTVESSGKVEIAIQNGESFSGKLELNYKSSEGNITIEGITPIYESSIKSGLDSCVIELKFPKKIEIDLNQKAKVSVSIDKYCYADFFDYPITHQDGIYAKVNSKGNLYYGNKRLKLWGVNTFPTRNLSYVKRIKKLGFNSVRIWARYFWTPSALKSGKLDDSRISEAGSPQKTFPYNEKEGLNSNIDVFDRYVAECRKKNLWVYMHAHGDTPKLWRDERLRNALFADDSFVAGGEDWEDWKLATMKLQAGKHHFVYLLYFDERYLKLYKAYASFILDHRNPYTGKRYAEDENVVAWQLGNENRFIYKLLGNSLIKWPEFFRTKLRVKWNQWLKKRYKNDSELLSTWKKLDSGESLTNDTVRLGPTYKDYKKYAEARSGDFINFAVELVTNRQKELRDFCRSFAPKGIGANTVPVVPNTQCSTCLPWFADDALSSDSISFCDYSWMLKSSLEVSPYIGQLQNQLVENKAVFIYETNTNSTNPYRVEHSYKLASFASLNDIDGIFWYSYYPEMFRNDKDTPGEAYLGGCVRHIRATHTWTTVWFEHDPVWQQAMTMAGQLYLSNAIKPARHPAIQTVGAKALYSYKYFKSLPRTRDAFRCGNRVRFELNKNDGYNMIPGGKPTKQIIYSPENGNLVIDTPKANIYVGYNPGQYKFSDNITIGNFNQPFLAFAMLSADNKPLTGSDSSKNIYVCAATNSTNTGYDFDYKGARRYMAPGLQVPRQKNAGKAPVIIDPLSYKIWFPNYLNAVFKSYDFAFRQNNEINLINASSFTNKSKPWSFIGKMHVNSREGEARIPKLDIDKKATMKKLRIHNKADTVFDKTWNPIPNLQWSDEYERARIIVKKSLKKEIEGTLWPTKSDCSFSVSGTKAFFSQRADLEVIFSKGKMSEIAISFNESPNLNTVIESNNKLFGNAVKKHIATHQAKQTEVIWRKQYDKTILTVTLSQFQSSTDLIYNIHEN